MPTSACPARLAGELLAKARTAYAVHAIVVAEALLSAPALIMTSDREDLERLLEGEPEAARVRVLAV